MNDAERTGRLGVRRGSMRGERKLPQWWRTCHRVQPSFREWARQNAARGSGAAWVPCGRVVDGRRARAGMARLWSARLKALDCTWAAGAGLLPNGTWSGQWGGRTAGRAAPGRQPSGRRRVRGPAMRGSDRRGWRAGSLWPGLLADPAGPTRPSGAAGPFQRCAGEHAPGPTWCRSHPGIPEAGPFLVGFCGESRHNHTEMPRA